MSEEEKLLREAREVLRGIFFGEVNPDRWDDEQASELGKKIDAFFGESK